jgi:hypothetical protein
MHLNCAVAAAMVRVASPSTDDGSSIERPLASLSRVLTVDGETRAQKPRPQLARRGDAGADPSLVLGASKGDYCVIAPDFIAERTYGFTEVPLFLPPGTARSWPRTVPRAFREDGRTSGRGDRQAGRRDYDYDGDGDGDEHYRVSFPRENTIVQTQMIATPALQLA